MFKPTKLEMGNYLEGIVRLAPYYMWGADMVVLNQSLLADLKKAYGNAHYANKEWNSKMGFFVSDCSGLLTNILGVDKTAQQYYNLCKNPKKTTAVNPPSYALVFRGTPDKIVHVGVLLDGYTYEMYNRCDKKKYDKAYWNYVGQLDFMVTEAVDETIPQAGTYALKKAAYGYITASDAISGKNPKTTLQPGTYHIYSTYKNKALNLTKSKGVPGAWIKL